MTQIRRESIDEPARDPGKIELTSVWGLRLTTDLRLPRYLDLSFDQFLTGTDWHPWESADTTAFRWMGKTETATVDLAVDRSVDLVVDLGIYMIIDPAFEKQLEIFVDGDEAHSVNRRTIEGVSFVLPKLAGDGALTRLTIRAGQGIVNLPDPRRLSVAFSYLRVRPLGEQLEEETRLTLREQFAVQLRGAGDDWPLRYNGTPCVIANL